MVYSNDFKKPEIVGQYPRIEDDFVNEEYDHNLLEQISDSLHDLLVTYKSFFNRKIQSFNEYKVKRDKKSFTKVLAQKIVDFRRIIKKTTAKKSLKQIYSRVVANDTLYEIIFDENIKWLKAIKVYLEVTTTEYESCVGDLDRMSRLYDQFFENMKRIIDEYLVFKNMALIFTKNQKNLQNLFNKTLTEEKEKYFRRKLIH